MELDSPRQDAARPKLTARAGNLLAGRERPLFTNKASYNAYEEPHFITDSLNTSFAPSPSPARQSYSAIPRPSLTNGRSRTTWTSKTQTEKIETDSPRAKSSDAFSDRVSDKYSLLRTSSPRLRSRRSPTPSRVERRKSHTPSPTRDRAQYSLVSPISNASESSPPRELGESYRRIKDEEFLAQHQGSGSEGSAGDFNEEDVLRDIINGEVPEHLRSPTPSSRRSSRRFSPQVVAGTPAQENVAPRQRKGSSNSGNSSPFDEVTQEDLQVPDRPVNKMPLTEREKRKVRTQQMINGPPLFSKARRLGSPLLSGDSKKDDASSHSAQSSQSSQSGSSKMSDPSLGSLNIPANWGRKARRVGPWLDRIKETAPDKVAPEPKTEDPPVQPQADDKVDSVAEWVENSAPEANVTIDSDSFRPDETEDVALTGPQLASAVSAALRPAQAVVLDNQSASSRPWVSKLDGIQDRERSPELERLEKKALATNMLGELKEKRSVDSIGRKSTGDSQKARDTRTESAASDEKPRLGLVAPTVEEPESFADDRGSLNGLEVSATSGNGLEGIDESPHRHEPEQSSSTVKDERPSHERHDSWELLRALSRAESKSPSPVPEAIDRPSKTQHQPPKTQAANPQPTRATQSAKDTATNTPQVQSKLNTKTPKVAGGWIDTPATKASAAPKTASSNLQSIAEHTKSQAEHETKSSSTNPVNLDATAPKLKTALEEILEKAKADKAKRAGGEDVDSTVLIDDSTLQSLEELLTDPDTSERIALTSVDPTDGAQDLLQRAAQIASEKKEQADKHTLGPASQAYQSLVSRLSHLGAHIADSKNSMTALQRRVSKFPQRKFNNLAKLASTADDEEDEDQECHEAGELHDFILVCPKCGTGGDTAWLRQDPDSPPASFIEWQTVKVPMPKLWSWQRQSKLPHLTRKGWIGLALFVLWAANYMVDDAYTPPFYAARMRGFGVDYHMPRPPFVVFKLFWRNVLAPLVLPLWFGVCVFFRMVVSICGFDPWSLEYRTSHASPAAVQPAASDMGFGADELL